MLVRISTETNIFSLILLFVIRTPSFLAIVGGSVTANLAISQSTGLVPGEVTANDQFVTREGSQLFLSGRRFRFAGANIYWLAFDDNVRDNDGNPQYPSRFCVNQVLDGAVATNCTVIRSHTLGISVGSSRSVEPKLHRFNEAAFESIDYAIYQAGQKGLKLIIPLTDQWRYFHGGKWTFVHWGAEQDKYRIVDVNPDKTMTVGKDFKGETSQKYVEQQFYSSPIINGYFKEYISHLLNHINPYNKLALKDDPTILAWEIGNELFDSPNDWTQSIAAYIKHELHAKQLVMDGSSASGKRVSEAALEASDIDIVGSHYYHWPVGLDPKTIAEDASAASQAKKAFVIGEWGWSLPGRAAFLSAIENNEAIAGDLYWSLLPYQENGTPEPHGTLNYGADDVPMYIPGISIPMKVAITELKKHAQIMQTAK